MATNPVTHTSTAEWLRLAVGDRKGGIQPGHVLVGVPQSAWRLAQWVQKGYVVHVGKRYVLTRKGWDVIHPNGEHYGYL